MRAGVLVAIIIIGLAAIGYLWSSRQQPESTEPARKLTIGVEHSILSAAVWVAEERGYFGREGLDLTIRGYDSGRLSFMAMLRGEVDVSTAAPTPIVFQSFERQDFSILATFAYSYNDIKVIARQDRGINTVSDLKGKRIGTPAGTTGQFFVEAFLMHNEIMVSEVEVTDIAPSDLPDALSDNRVDAIVIWEPHGHRALQLLKDRAIRLPSSHVYRVMFNFLVMKDFARKNPEVLKRFLRSIDEATRFIRNNGEESKAIVAKALGLNEEAVNTFWDDFVLEISLDQSLLITLEDEARWAIKNNLTDKTEVPNYLDFVFMDVLDQAKPKAVTIIR
jgi:NitT/TauT family transport system substrate-binding protein